MSKVHIPTHAIKMVENINSSNWDQTRDKFITIVHDLHPHLTYQECLDKFTKILDRKQNAKYAYQFMEEYKQKMKKSYDRWIMYKKFNQQDDIKTCESWYLNVDKSCYDRQVDALSELGITEPYAPTNMADLPRFITQKQREDNFEVIITSIVVCAIILGLLFLAWDC